LEAREFLVGRPEGKRPLGKPSSRWDKKLEREALPGVQGRNGWWALAYAVINFRFH
jgi:hypothetical protein